MLPEAAEKVPAVTDVVSGIGEKIPMSAFSGRSALAFLRPAPASYLQLHLHPLSYLLLPSGQRFKRQHRLIILTAGSFEEKALACVCVCVCVCVCEGERERERELVETRDRWGSRFVNQANRV